MMRRINRGFPLIVLAQPRDPVPAGFALSGGSLVAAASSALLWGGLVRIFLVHHITWSINSICHFFGRRRFETDDESTNVFWLALPSLGEAWHHNHHAFPRSAFHGLRWYELDPSGWLILAMAKRRPRLGRRARHARARDAKLASSPGRPCGRAERRRARGRAHRARWRRRGSARPGRTGRREGSDAGRVAETSRV